MDSRIRAILCSLRVFGPSASSELKCRGNSLPQRFPDDIPGFAGCRVSARIVLHNPHYRRDAGDLDWTTIFHGIARDGRPTSSSMKHGRAGRPAPFR